MFKKSLFLGLALTMSANIASANCLTQYQEERNISERTHVAVGAAAGVTATYGLAGSRSLPYKAPLVKTAAVVGIGGLSATTGHDQMRKHELDKVISVFSDSYLIRDSDQSAERLLKRVLVLRKLNNEVNALLAQQNRQATDVKTLALTLTQMNEKGEFCSKDSLDSYVQLRNKVTTKLSK